MYALTAVQLSARCATAASQGREKRKTSRSRTRPKGRRLPFARASVVSTFKHYELRARTGRLCSRIDFSAVEERRAMEKLQDAESAFVRFARVRFTCDKICRLIRFTARICRSISLAAMRRRLSSVRRSVRKTRRIRFLSHVKRKR